MLNFSEINWSAFKETLYKEYRKMVADDRYRYAQRFYYCLVNRDLSDLRMLSDNKKSHVMKALSSLSKYLGVYDLFKDLVKKHGLKWSKRNIDDLIIARLTKPNNCNEIVEWIKEVKRKIIMFSDFADLILTTGLRFEEAVNSYNLIIDLATQGKLREYYDAEREVLEHFKYKDFFLRNSKKVFISFVPKGMMEKLVGCRKLTKYTIVMKVKRAGLKSRWSDLREFYATYMTKHLSESEIDFIQGRVSASVFKQHYFNPVWITDLKQRALKGAEEIVAKIN